MDVLALGSTNGGVFSRRDALGAGESDASLARLCRQGDVLRLRRGMYVLAQTYRACDDVGRHVLHARAEAAAQDGEVCLSGVSAAALFGFDLHDQDLTCVDVLRLDGGATHRTRAAVHRRAAEPLGDDEIKTVDGLRVVTPARAVWEVACRSSIEAGVATADSALHRNPELRAELMGFRERYAHHPGSRAGRMALRLADGRAESVGESITRVQLYRHSIPKPELQHEIRDADGRLIARTDFWWKEFRHVGEFDGRVKYGRLRKKGETAEQAVVREKDREDDIRAERCGMTRFIWQGVMPDTAARTMAKLARLLTTSRQLYVFGLGLAASVRSA